MRWRGWKPISTAPTNGEVVDLWVYDPIGRVGYRYAECMFAEGEWFQLDDDGKRLLITTDTPYQAVAWRPLPEGPEQFS